MDINRINGNYKISSYKKTKNIGKVGNKKNENNLIINDKVNISQSDLPASNIDKKDLQQQIKERSLPEYNSNNSANKSLSDINGFFIADNLTSSKIDNKLKESKLPYSDFHLVGPMRNLSTDINNLYIFSDNAGFL